jgi:hypothetical protein
VLALLTLIALAVVMLSGCASKREGRVAEPAAAAGSWECAVVDGDLDAPWYAREAGSWWNDSGSYFIVHRSSPESLVLAADPGAAALLPETTEDAAVWEAVDAGASDVLRLLGLRDVEYTASEGARLRTRTSRALVGGRQPEFPRAQLAGLVTERCSVGHGAVETWRATILLEYPAAFLQGDANNARWEGQRLESEAGVLYDSARSFFGEGLWLEGLIELAAARRLLERAARPLEANGLVARIEEMMDWARHAVVVEPVSATAVVEIGAREAATAEFACHYEWDGRRIAATRVPIEFEARGFRAVLSCDVESDGNGAAKCRILSAYGEPGSYEIVPVLNARVVSAAVGHPLWGRAALDEGGVVQVFLVAGAHAVTVCLELDGADAQDGAQFRSGYNRRMEAGGFGVGECGPDTDVLVRAAVGVSSGQQGEEWHAVAAVDASAFDQRSARTLGEAKITVAESSPDAARDAEVLALKELGRLVAAYYSRRILAAGP